ncbi:MAG: glycine oxidase ThiO, partial [Rubricoccaceae bacterium]|nr:glycine oxidase ThiO [Rubricoccaceae bacterium]
VDVAVIGGGIIGLSTAWRLMQRGYSVEVFEAREIGKQASWSAAGMLSPAAEIGFEELDLYRLGRESLRRWPRFAQELEGAGRRSVGYRDDGTLVVAVDRDDVESMRRLFRFQQQQGVPVTWLAGFEALEIEPLLAPGLPAAIHSPEDHQVDNRAVLLALIDALKPSEQVAIYENKRVISVEADDSGARVMLDDGESRSVKVAVVSAGAWTAGIEGIVPAPIRPIKGQILTLQANQEFEMQHVVRGPDAYIVPKSDGRIVIGATSEDLGFDSETTAGGIYRLLEGAIEIAPGVEELEFIRSEVGFRPASRDHAPLVGWMSPRIMIATGHYRHGVLLAPVTADEIALEVDTMLKGGKETSAWLPPFSPKRFT